VSQLPDRFRWPTSCGLPWFVFFEKAQHRGEGSYTCWRLFLSAHRVLVLNIYIFNILTVYFHFHAAFVTSGEDKSLARQNRGFFSGEYRWTAPSKLFDLFTRADSVHSYNTRSASAGRFYIKHSGLKQQSHSFSHIGCKTWNGLPEHLRTKNKTSFKKCLLQTILQLLEHEENYVDVHTLIKKIPSFRSITTNRNYNILRINRHPCILIYLYIYLFVISFFFHICIYFLC